MENVHYGKFSSATSIDMWMKCVSGCVVAHIFSVHELSFQKEHKNKCFPTKTTAYLQWQA